MTDLSHWDFAENFSGREIACLILGIEPTDSDDARIKPVLTRLSLAYRSAIQTAYSYYSKGDPVQMDKPRYRPGDLQGVIVETIHHSWQITLDIDQTISHIEGLWEEFDIDRFSRAEVCRWMTASGLPSKYSFAIVGNGSPAVLSGDASAVAATPINDQLGDRQRNNLLNIIGGLLHLMLEPGPSGKPRSGYNDQSAIILALTVHFPNGAGMSKRNLEKYFAESRRSIQST